MVSLKDWLAEKGLSNAEFGRRIDRPAETVRRYAEGLRIPDKDTMPLIFAETLGAVDANSFHNLSLVDDGDTADETTASADMTGDRIAQAAA